MALYTRKDGTQVKYNTTETSLKWYHSHNNEMYKCDACNKEIKLVSKAKHEKTQIHLRAMELLTKIPKPTDTETEIDMTDTDTDTDTEVPHSDTRYINGKIYRLDYGDLTYVGSTILPLSIRFRHHAGKNSTCSSRTLFERASAENGTVTINLIEEYPCESRTELNIREGYYQQQIKCVNTLAAGGGGATSRIYVRKDGSISEYDQNAYNRKYYDKTSQQAYKCEYCQKTIKAVSRLAHERGKAHIRAKVLCERFYDMDLPKLDASLTTEQIEFSMTRDVRNRSETTLERETQNAYYEASNLKEKYSI